MHVTKTKILKHQTQHKTFVKKNTFKSLFVLLKQAVLSIVLHNALTTIQFHYTSFNNMKTVVFSCCCCSSDAQTQGTPQEKLTP